MTRLVWSHNHWLESESFVQNLWVSDTETQFVCTQRNEHFVLQWWPRLAQMFCFDCQVVLCYLLRIKCPQLAQTPETLISLSGLQDRIYWNISSCNIRLNPVKWVILIAITLRMSVRLFLWLAQGDAALWLQLIGPNVSVAAIHCWRSSGACETGK